MALKHELGVCDLSGSGSEAYLRCAGSSVSGGPVRWGSEHGGAGAGRCSRARPRKLGARGSCSLVHASGWNISVWTLRELRLVQMSLFCSDFILLPVVNCGH